MHDNDSTTVDLKTFPTLNKTAEGVRQKIVNYLDRMQQVGKTPSSVMLFVDDYSAIVRAIKKRREAAYRDSGNEAPPRAGLGLRRPAGHVRREGVSHAF